MARLKNKLLYRNNICTLLNYVLYFEIHSLKCEGEWLVKLHILEILLQLIYFMSFLNNFQGSLKEKC